ncbi:MAG: SDR family oxidoreductase [Clostridiales bacterium]|jgi:short-subunit dehydrogenase|nr:SDR family oxidoreductase [Clostridiales bacterium]
MENKVVVITGGSKGIGAELVKFFQIANWQVISISRTFNDYNRDNIYKISCDVSNEKQVYDAISEVIDKFGRIDMLINNAGMGISGAVEHTTSENVKKIFDINVIGLSYFTQACLPYLRETKGKIINISSLAAVLPIPYQSYYCAAKAAVNLFGDSLRNEIRPFGVQIMTVMPGDVSTSFTDNRVKAEEVGSYGSFVEKSVAVMEKDERGGMSAEYAAKVIFKKAIKKRIPHHLVVGTDYKILWFISKLVPKKLLSYILFKMYGGQD